MTAESRRRGGVRPLVPAGVPLRVAAIAGPIALLSLFAVLLYGDALEPAIAVLRQAGPVTTYGLPIAELMVNASGAITVGWLLLTVVYVPAEKRPSASGSTLSPAGRRGLRAASLTAIVWALSALSLATFSMSNLLGRSVPDVLSGGALVTYFVDLGEGRALLVIAVVAAALSVTAHLPRSPLEAGTLLLAAILALTPTVFTGHAAAADNHSLAVFSLAVHIAGAGVWVGGLVVLIAAGRGLGGLLPGVVTRFSGLALGCFVAVGASGLINAYVRLGGIELESPYGRLVVAKTLALVVLGLLGFWHRQASIPALRRARRGGTFVRIAAVEVIVMMATIALATGLSRTPPPLLDTPLGNREAYLLGFDLPGPPGVLPIAVDWWVDPLFVLLIAVGAVLYTIGLVRLWRADTPWPVRRAVAWYTGLLIVFIASSSGLAKYSMVIFSAHIVQHLLIGALVPIALVLGAPVTLARRTLRAGGVTGAAPREMFAAVTGGGAARLLTHPLVSVPVFVATLYGFYLTSLFETSLADHAIHSLTLVAVLIAGALFLWPVLGGEHAPHRFELPVRFAAVLALVPAHAYFALVFASSQGVLASNWFSLFKTTWAGRMLDDQQFGGVLGWWIGLGCTVTVLLLLVYQWVRGTGGAPADGGGSGGGSGHQHGGGSAEVSGDGVRGARSRSAGPAGTTGAGSADPAGAAPSGTSSTAR